MKVQDRFDKNRIGDLVCDGAYKYVHNFAVEIDGKRVAEYNSLDGVVEEWEDYKPAEPLIKDEKIRKAVRAWTEVNNRDVFEVINEHFNCCKIIGYTDGGTPSCDIIEFGTTIAGADKGYYYTIAELCGEEEE